MCDDCLVGCHYHCGDPDIGAGPCNCNNFICVTIRVNNGSMVLDQSNAFGINIPE